MSTTRSVAAPPQSPATPRPSMHDQVLFWGCFVALVTTSFGFITRMFLEDTWREQFQRHQDEAEDQPVPAAKGDEHLGHEMTS